MSNFKISLMIFIILGVSLQNYEYAGGFSFTVSLLVWLILASKRAAAPPRRHTNSHIDDDSDSHNHHSHYHDSHVDSDPSSDCSDSGDHSDSGGSHD